jgi:hypothetical protein
MHSLYNRNGKVKARKTHEKSQVTTRRLHDPLMVQITLNDALWKVLFSEFEVKC